jgi:AcrR family transcriptional regulator
LFNERCLFSKHCSTLSRVASSTSTSPLPDPPRRSPRRRRPPTRRTALSVDAIVAAAIEVLDEAGVAGLTMRRVAERVGTGAGSLYVHVADKEELLELVYDELVGRVPLAEPDPAHWREQVHQMMRGLYDVLVSHRDAALAGMGRVPTTPLSLRAAEALVAVLRAGGLSDRVVGLGLDQLALYVSANAFEAGLRDEQLRGEDVQRYFDEVHAFFHALPADRFPVLASIASEMTGHDGVERFEFGLDVILDGLESASRPKRRARA